VSRICWELFVNRYRHTDQYEDGKRAIHDEGCEMEEKRPEGENKKPSREEIRCLLLGLFRKLKVNFFREIFPQHLESHT